MNSVLARNLRRLRLEKGLSQAALSQASGTSAIGMIEAGWRSSPQHTTLQKIASALGVTVDDLVRKPRRVRR